MKPYAIHRKRNTIAGLDNQSVTSGTIGAAGSRIRGFSTTNAIGSIVDGTSNVFAGAAITELYWDESALTYVLKITGATNTGWTTLTIDGAKVLNRAAATFATNTWTWTTTDAVGVQAFGGAGSTHICVFT